MIKWRPRTYQREAIAFLLANKFSGLFLDPGLGKTSTTLAAIKILKAIDEIDSVLLIAPLRVCQLVWPGEVEKWENFKDVSMTFLHGNKGKKTLWGPKKDIYLMNPEGLPWLYDELAQRMSKGMDCPFNTLWIDESTKFKSATAKTRFKLIKDMLPLFQRRHIMTGTPATRGLLDLWTQIYILDEGESLSPNYYKFRNKFFYTEEWNKFKWNIKEGSADTIHRAVAPLVLEMKAEEYLDMPELSFNEIVVELPSKVRKTYTQMEREFFTEFEGNTLNAEQSAQASMKCHQIANGCVYEDVPEDLDDQEVKAFKKTRKTILLHKAKVEALKDLVEELNGKPLLIAYHFKHDLEALRSLFGADLPYIGSGVRGTQLKQLETDWNAGKLPILAGNPASMGHGLNLQESSNDVCFFSLLWNLEDYEQFYRRVYRQGVKGGHVRVHHIIAKDTVDEAMISRLGERAKEQTDLRTAIKKYAKEARTRNRKQ